MITVCFYGNLRQFGRRFRMDATSPADALRGILLQVEGLAAHLKNGTYQVRVGGQDYTEDQVKSQFNTSVGKDLVIHIVPRVQGAGKNGGVLQVITGIVIIIFSWWNPLGWAGGGALMSGVLAGASMVMGGVAQMLAKPPSMDLDKTSAEASRNSSFSNTDNMAAQGTPVPLAYGLMYTGSKVISQGVVSRRVYPQSNQSNQSAPVRGWPDLFASVFYGELSSKFIGKGSKYAGLGDTRQVTLWTTKSASNRAHQSEASHLAMYACQNALPTVGFTLSLSVNQLLGYVMAAVDKLVQLGYMTITASREDVESYARNNLYQLKGGTTDPAWLDMSYELRRVYHTPVAAIAPNGTPYSIDLNNDSVRGANYTALSPDE